MSDQPTGIREDNIQGGVAASRGDTGMAKPLTDRDDIDARAQQMYCRTLAMLLGCKRLAVSVGVIV